MMTYKLCSFVPPETKITVVLRSDNLFIPFDPANTDYQQFKKDLANGVQLQDANGNVMTAEQVTAFLGTLK